MNTLIFDVSIIPNSTSSYFKIQSETSLAEYNLKMPLICELSAFDIIFIVLFLDTKSTFIEVNAYI